MSIPLSWPTYFPKALLSTITSRQALEFQPKNFGRDKHSVIFHIMIRKASWDSRLLDFSSVMYLACFPGLRMAILTGVIWYCGLGFHLSWSMMLRSFLCLWAICVSNLEKCLCRSSDCFLIRLFDFLVLSWISWCILDLNPLSDARFVNIFFH